MLELYHRAFAKYEIRLRGHLGNKKPRLDRGIWLVSTWAKKEPQQPFVETCNIISQMPAGVQSFTLRLAARVFAGQRPGAGQAPEPVLSSVSPVVDQVALALG